ncbi:hypothetical protein BDN67DRAFT_1017301, partial [Paxillus ammoniavirescens]
NDEKVAVTKGLGTCATDQTVDGVSLVDLTSSQDEVPAAQINTPTPPSLTTPTLPPTSNEMRRTCEDEGKSRGRGDSRGREGKEAAGRIDEQMSAVQGPGRGAMNQTASSDDDDDGDDVNVHHIHVEPQSPHTICQTAVNEAADTMDPNTTGAGQAVQVACAKCHMRHSLQGGSSLLVESSFPT